MGIHLCGGVLTPQFIAEFIAGPIVRAYKWLRFYRLHGMSPSEVAKHRTTIYDTGEAK